jgi:hypothetical protein
MSGQAFFFRAALGAVFGAIAALSFPAAAVADLVIDYSPTQNVSCSGGVCTATAANAVLSAYSLKSMLASSNVTVSTGSVANNIDVNAAISWVSANSLTVEALVSIMVMKPISVAGTGGVSLVTNSAGGTSGVLQFSYPGALSFLGTSNSLTVNGAAYTLENSIATLASAIASSPSGNFALSASYDATPDGTYSSSPIPTVFTGNFQGLGNTISNLTIANQIRTDYIGLFSELGTGGSIQNVLLNHSNVTGQAYIGRDVAIGGLVGISNGYLFGSTVNGYIHARNGDPAVVGLLTGWNLGQIVSSHASGRVMGYYAGGIAGFSKGTQSLIEQCDSSAEVTGLRPFGSGSTAGGLVGLNFGATIENSHASGAVVAYDAGGLAGENDGGTISSSYATGAVSGDNHLDSVGGGLVGMMAQYSASITNSYSTGNVSAETYQGGFAGSQAAGTNPTSIVNSYSTGSVSTGEYLGGFVGDNQEAANQGYADAYWNVTTSGTTNGTGTGNAATVTGLTTAQLQSGLPAGFDPTIWAENPSINNGFPYLIANPPPQ